MMPRLSEDLPGTRWPGICQACDGRDRTLFPGEGKHVVTPWQEHDERDRPELICVWLCRGCSDRIIDPHPRLYARMDQWEKMPFPGIMGLCEGCLWRRGPDCANPLQKRLGGSGLGIEYPRPQKMFIDCSPRSASGLYTVFSGPPTSCAGRLTKEGVQDAEGGFDYL